jgi:hypothetical protein
MLQLPFTAFSRMQRLHGVDQSGETRAKKSEQTVFNRTFHAAASARSSCYFLYHTVQRFAGFIFDLGEQSKALANFSNCLTEPFTLETRQEITVVNEIFQSSTLTVNYWKQAALLWLDLLRGSSNLSFHLSLVGLPPHAFVHFKNQMLSG